MNITLYDGRTIPGDEVAKVIEGIGKLGRFGTGRAHNALPCASQVVAAHFGSPPIGFNSLMEPNDAYLGTTEGRAKHVAKFLRGF